MAETVAIIDYGSGNLRSAAKAFERSSAEVHAGKHAIIVTENPDQVAAADRVVLPGVGAFADCMDGLCRIDGMRDALDQAVLRRAVPFFGICVGMQLMATRGLEDGTHGGLGWFAGDVVKLAPRGDAGTGMPYKVPHMGWNELRLTRDHPLFTGIAEGDHAYFVHSYHMAAEITEAVLAHVEYGQQVTAIIGRDNMFGTQFHPEKSQHVGLRLIANFLGWQP